MTTLSPETKQQFSAIVAPHMCDLRRFALSLARNHADADDLVQETMLRAAVKLHLWEPGTNIMAWLIVMMRRIFLSQLTSLRNRSEHTPIEEWDCSIKASQTDTVELREVQSKLGLLSRDHIDVIRVVALGGASYEEAAERFNVPVGTIRSRLCRARNQLRGDAENVH
jgi:RNA polymerase sigma-70 factor (ECF subfamily)